MQINRKCFGIHGVLRLNVTVYVMGVALRQRFLLFRCEAISITALADRSRSFHAKLG
jgi:hypothetical protein